MANGDLFRALDQLAGVAGQEIEKARQQRLALAQQAAAIARQQEQFNQQMDIEKGKLGIQAAQLGLAMRQADSEKKKAELKDRQDDIEARNKLLEKNNRLYDSISDNITNQQETFAQLLAAGAPAEVLDNIQQEINYLLDLRSQIPAFRAFSEEPAGEIPVGSPGAMGTGDQVEGVPQPSPQGQTGMRGAQPLNIDVEESRRRRRLQEARDAYDSKVLQNAANRVAKLNEIAPQIQTVLSEWLETGPPSSKQLGALGAQAQAWRNALVANVLPGVAPDRAAYQAAAQGIGTLLARSLGDVGNIAAAEREINVKMIPKLTDTEETGRAKAQVLLNLVDAVRSKNVSEIKRILNDADIPWIQQTGLGGLVETDSTNVGTNLIKPIGSDAQVDTVATDTVNVETPPESTNRKSRSQEFIDRLRREGKLPIQ